MQFFGFSVTRNKSAQPSAVDGGRGWMPIIREPYTGAWQRNEEVSIDDVSANNAVFACITLIAADIGKLRPKLVSLDSDGIWTETSSPAFSPVLRRPNRYQNHIQFKERWITSKLLTGNTYVLLERDARGIVVAMYVLDPSRVKPLVANDGSVYYELRQDNLAGLQADTLVVPAREMIHDRINCLFHDLVGLSPLFSAGYTADQGLRIQRDSSAFFGNSSNPGGVLTAPGVIKDDTAQRMKEHWEKNFSGSNSGRIAVLGDGLKFEAMRMTAVESQLTDQINLSAKVICSAFHVPPFMVGLGEEPTYSNGETRTGHYYSQCLQAHIEQMEICLDDALGVGYGVLKDGRTLGVELDLTGLLRMDTKTQMEALRAGVEGCLMAPNEARRVLNLPPVAGGNTIYMQQQNYSLEALNSRPPPDSEPSSEDAAAKAVAEAMRLMKEQADAADTQRNEREAAMERRHAELMAEVKRAQQPDAAEDADDLAELAEYIAKGLREAAHAA